MSAFSEIFAQSKIYLCQLSKTYSIDSNNHEDKKVYEINSFMIWKFCNKFLYLLLVKFFAPQNLSLSAIENLFDWFKQFTCQITPAKIFPAKIFPPKYSRQNIPTKIFPPKYSSQNIPAKRARGENYKLYFLKYTWSMLK